RTVAIAALSNGCRLIVMPLDLLLSKRVVQNERKTHAGLAQLLGNVVRGSRDVFVRQSVRVAFGGLGKQPIGIGFGYLERLDSPIDRRPRTATSAPALWRCARSDPRRCSSRSSQAN